jgi:hypothetical protein
VQVIVRRLLHPSNRNRHERNYRSEQTIVKAVKFISYLLPDAAIKAQLGIDVDVPTFVRIPIDFQNGTIEVDILSRLNGKGPADARAFIGLSYRIMDPEAHFETIFCARLTAARRTRSTRVTSAQSSTSPTRTGSSIGCARSILTDTTKAGLTSLTTNGSRCGPISRAHACASPSWQG